MRRIQKMEKKGKEEEEMALKFLFLSFFLSFFLSLLSVGRCFERAFMTRRGGGGRGGNKKL